MATQRVIEAGHEVAAKIADMKAQAVRPSQKVPGCFDSETLCAFQRKVSGMGYVEAEIVESNYGYSVRYASGLQNFGLIYSARQRQVDGTLESAIAAAKRWQQQDPRRRYVTRLATI